MHAAAWISLGKGKETNRSPRRPRLTNHRRIPTALLNASSRRRQSSVGRLHVRLHGFLGRKGGVGVGDDGVDPFGEGEAGGDFLRAGNGSVDRCCEDLGGKNSQGHEREGGEAGEVDHFGGRSERLDGGVGEVLFVCRWDLRMLMEGTTGDAGVQL